MPTKTGEYGVGVVAGAAQEQGTQGAAEREAAWDLDGTVRQAVVRVFCSRGPFFVLHVPDDHADICAWMRRHVWAGMMVSIMRT